MDKQTVIFLLIFMPVQFILYNGYVWLKYGVQKSISADFYVLKENYEKGLYSLFIVCTAIPFMILSNNTLGWWAGALLMIDAAATLGGDDWQMKLHLFGAKVGMGLALLMCWIVFGQWYLVVGFVMFSLIALKLKNSVTWIETAAFIAVYIGLLLNYL